MTTPPQTHRRSSDKKTALDTESLRQNLLMILAHLFDLRLRGSQARGYFIGTNGVPDLRMQLDGIVQAVCSLSAMLDRITHRIVTVVDIIRSVHDRDVTTDLPTADRLRVITEVLEGRGRLPTSQAPKSKRFCEFRSRTHDFRAIRATRQT